MNFFFSALLFMILSLGAGSAAHAADKPASAFAELKQARKLLGEGGAHLLSMESENGTLQPRYWWIRFYDEKLFFKMRSVQMIGPDMVRNMEPGNPFDGGNKDYIIHPEQLKCDSDKCIAFMERAAKESAIPLHSINVQLRKPYPEESNPIWYFEWFGAKGNSLGTINISATTGRVTEIVGLKIKSKRFQNVSHNTLSENVEDTFLGIGADLEEFFTGKRTVDKDKEAAKGKDQDQQESDSQAPAQ